MGAGSESAPAGPKDDSLPWGRGGGGDPRGDGDPEEMGEGEGEGERAEERSTWAAAEEAVAAV